MCQIGPGQCGGRLFDVQTADKITRFTQDLVKPTKKKILEVKRKMNVFSGSKKNSRDLHG